MNSIKTLQTVCNKKIFFKKRSGHLLRCFRKKGVSKVKETGRPWLEERIYRPPLLMSLPFPSFHH